MGRTCGTNGRRRMDIGYWWERYKKQTAWKTKNVGEFVILKLILEKQVGVVWTGLI
jgi:hypothetical protein